MKCFLSWNIFLENSRGDLRRPCTKLVFRFYSLIFYREFKNKSNNHFDCSFYMFSLSDKNLSSFFVSRTLINCTNTTYALENKGCDQFKTVLVHFFERQYKKYKGEHLVRQQSIMKILFFFSFITVHSRDQELNFRNFTTL